MIKRRRFSEGIALGDLDRYSERGKAVCLEYGIKVSRGTPYHDPGSSFLAPLAFVHRVWPARDLTRENHSVHRGRQTLYRSRRDSGTRCRSRARRATRGFVHVRATCPEESCERHAPLAVGTIPSLLLLLLLLRALRLRDLTSDVSDDFRTSTSPKSRKSPRSARLVNHSSCSTWTGP